MIRINRHLRPPVTFAFFRRVAGISVFLAVLLSLMVAIQVIPEWQVKRASVRSAVANPEAKTTPADVAALQNELRKTFLQMVGGAFALIALYLTYRRVKVTEQGHITDRYTKAIEQLGMMTAENRSNVEVRLGAIYALERIAIDSSRDHWTIMEVLTAYVRQNAAKTAQLRRCTVEHPFATIKYRIFGHPRLLMRGLTGARAEIGIATMAYNLKRITNVLGTAKLTKTLLHA